MDCAPRDAWHSRRTPTILVINGGSSSLKFALFTHGAQPERLRAGRIERIGLPDATWTIGGTGAEPPETRRLDVLDHRAGVALLIAWLERQALLADVVAVGHRVVHGGPRYFDPMRVTPSLLDELRRMASVDPDHLPSEIALIEAFAALDRDRPQVACFDTAFHRELPAVARLLPIPRRFATAGIRRYGFHGLSFRYLMEQLARIAGPTAAAGRVVLAHLGAGASVAAVRDGRSLDTSMSFTPAGGLVMSTLPGDLDPGVVAALLRNVGGDPTALDRLLNRESGLLGVSETSGDVRDLLAREAADPRAAEALALFCHQTKKWIGAYAAVLGGLDTLVFSGGIGENAAAIRARICDGLDFLDVVLDPARNATGAALVSRDGARVAVRVIPTDEEATIARDVYAVLEGQGAACAER